MSELDAFAARYDFPLDEFQVRACEALEARRVPDVQVEGARSRRHRRAPLPRELRRGDGNGRVLRRITRPVQGRLDQHPREMDRRERLTCGVTSLALPGVRQPPSSGARPCLSCFEHWAGPSGASPASPPAGTAPSHAAPRVETHLSRAERPALSSAS